MEVELRLRGTAQRIVTALYPDASVHYDGHDTIIRTQAPDDAGAAALADRAREVGFRVVSWRCLDEPGGA